MNTLRLTRARATTLALVNAAIMRQKYGNYLVQCDIGDSYSLRHCRFAKRALECSISGVTDTGWHIQAHTTLSLRAEINEESPYDKFLVVIESEQTEPVWLWCDAEPTGISFKLFGDPVM